MVRLFQCYILPSTRTTPAAGDDSHIPPKQQPIMRMSYPGRSVFDKRQYPKKDWVHIVSTQDTLPMSSKTVPVNDESSKTDVEQEQKVVAESAHDVEDEQSICLDDLCSSNHNTTTNNVARAKLVEVEQ